MSGDAEKKDWRANCARIQQLKAAAKRRLQEVGAPTRDEYGEPLDFEDRLLSVADPELEGIQAALFGLVWEVVVEHMERDAPRLAAAWFGRRCKLGGPIRLDLDEATSLALEAMREAALSWCGMDARGEPGDFYKFCWGKPNAQASRASGREPRSILCRVLDHANAALISGFTTSREDRRRYLRERCAGFETGSLEEEREGILEREERGE